eukprot:1529402-Amphidinium_carterae.1
MSNHPERCGGADAINISSVHTTRSASYGAKIAIAMKSCVANIISLMAAVAALPSLIEGTGSAKEDYEQPT